jgi:hypothetical protein
MHYNIHESDYRKNLSAIKYNWPWGVEVWTCGCGVLPEDGDPRTNGEAGAAMRPAWSVEGGTARRFWPAHAGAWAVFHKILFSTNTAKETQKARQVARAGRTNPNGKQLGTPGLDR